MSNFVICINNDSNTASLILGKVYLRLPEVAEQALMAESKRNKGTV